MNPIFSLRNITKSRITSILGVIIILTSLVSVFYPGVSWGDAAVGMGVGLVLLGLKDPPLSSTGAAAAVVVCAVALVGCAGLKHLHSEPGLQPATPVVALSDTLRLPVALTTRADSLNASFDLDSLANAWGQDTVHLVSAGNQAKLSVWKSGPSSGPGARFNVRADVPPRVVHDTITKVVTLYGKCPPGYTLKPAENRPFYQPYWDYYRTITSGFFTLFVVLVGLGWVRRRR